MTLASWPPRFRESPACSEPEHLSKVDAAFERSGGPEAKWIQSHLCTVCPLATACLAQAMKHGEAGVWGGTGLKWRTEHGAPYWRAAS